MKTLGICTLLLGLGLTIVGCTSEKPKAPAPVAPAAGMDKMGDEQMKETPTVDHSKMKMDAKDDGKDDMPAEDSEK
jgi:hypothetical protein